MLGRLAIDFGNANTVVAHWNEADQQANPVKLEPYSRMQMWQEDQIPIIPSLIHYRLDGSYLVGNEVLRANVAEHEHTFGALKTTWDTVHAVQVGKNKITAHKAAQDFLAALIERAVKTYGISKDEPVAITVPVDTFERYSKWISDVCAKSGLTNVRFLDEPAAAALSSRQNIKQNDDYMVFDFGAGSLDIAIVRFGADDGSKTSSHCKVLGKKSMQLGGDNIDQWLVQNFLDQQQFDAKSEFAQNISRALLSECRAAKEKLSFAEAADISITDPQTGKALTLKLTRAALIGVLEEHDFFAKVNRIIAGAERPAHFDYGFKREKLSGIFMVGGSSIIPELQTQIKRSFGKDRVHISRPLDSIATGAAAFAAGATLFDHIQHDYAIEVRNIQAQKTQMKVIIKRGQKYPSKEPVATEIIKAVTYGQTKFQILIYEISKEEVEPGSEFIDLAQVVQKGNQFLRYVCLNKAQPTLLETRRPIMHNHPALQLDFRIDENKHLVIDSYRFETDEIKVPHMKSVVVVRLT